MKLRWAIFAGAAIAAALLIAFVVAKVTSTGAVLSGPLTLPDGSSVRILAVSYGTNHVAGSPLAKLARRAPRKVQQVARRVLGHSSMQVHTAITSDPALVVWVERLGVWKTHPGSHDFFVAYLANEDGICSGVEESIGTGIAALQFPIFPRRDSTLRLKIFHHTPGLSVITQPRVGRNVGVGELRFSNPAKGTHPHWHADTLPVTRMVGDLEVTLSHFYTGVDKGIERKTLNDGFRRVTAGSSDTGGLALAMFRLASRSDSSEVWTPIRCKVSDATGNVAMNTASSQGGISNPTRSPLLAVFKFAPPLWPDEAAWKVDFEVKRVSGFPAAELFTFRDVPLGLVGRTNGLGWVTNFNGATIAVERFVRESTALVGRPYNVSATSFSLPEISTVKFSIFTESEGVYVDLVSVRLDDGTQLSGAFWDGGLASLVYRFNGLPPSVKTADFTIAVHRSRRVEFLVKPELGPVDIELPTGP